MKIWELEQNHFNQYEDIDGRIWRFDIKGNLRSEDTNDDITDIHMWSKIQKMEFELYTVIDWKTVVVDTPIYVRDEKCDDWGKRHFASFKNGKVYVFPDGMTSWTQYENYAVKYNYAKLL